MNSPQQTSAVPVFPQQPPQPLGGAIIDGEGREIAITEQMILQACRDLEKYSVIPLVKRG